MKKWRAMVGVMVIVLCAAIATIHEFAANDPIHHFAEHPMHLLVVAAIAVGGGSAALAYSRLSRRAQRRVRLFGWGATASVLTLQWLWVLYRCALLSSVVVESGSTGWLLLTLAMCAIMSALFYIEFFRAWKTRVAD